MRNNLDLSNRYGSSHCNPYSIHQPVIPPTGSVAPEASLQTSVGRFYHLNYPNHHHHHRPYHDSFISRITTNSPEISPSNANASHRVMDQSSAFNRTYYRDPIIVTRNMSPHSRYVVYMF